MATMSETAFYLFMYYVYFNGAVSSDYNSVEWYND
jgi:hypothetical protein